MKDRKDFNTWREPQDCVGGLGYISHMNGASSYRSG
jgi:hypothetical protein